MGGGAHTLGNYTIGTPPTPTINPPPPSTSSPPDWRNYTNLGSYQVGNGNDTNATIYGCWDTSPHNPSDVASDFCPDNGNGVNGWWNLSNPYNFSGSDFQTAKLQGQQYLSIASVWKNTTSPTTVAPSPWLFKVDVTAPVMDPIPNPTLSPSFSATATASDTGGSGVAHVWLWWVTSDPLPGSCSTSGPSGWDIKTSGAFTTAPPTRQSYLAGCVADNAGNYSSVVTLQIQAPSTPSGVNGKAGSPPSTSALISWAGSSNASYFYNVADNNASDCSGTHYCLCTSEANCPTVKTPPFSVNTAPVLPSNRALYAYVAAQTNYGFGSGTPQVSQVFYTAPVAPLGQVNPNVTNISQTDFTASFAAPPTGTKYYVLATAGAAKFRSNPPTLGTSASFNNQLSAGTKYSLQLCTSPSDPSLANSDVACNSANAPDAYTKFGTPIVSWDKAATTDKQFTLSVNAPQTPGTCSQVTYGGNTSNITLSQGSNNVPVTGSPNTQYTGITVTIGGLSCTDGSQNASAPAISATTMPQAPTITNVTPQSQSSVQASFSPSQNGLSYYVKVLTSAGTWLFDSVVGGSPITVTGLPSAGTTYLFKACTMSVDQTNFHQDDVSVENVACSATKPATTQFSQPSLFIDQTKASGGPPASIHAKISFGQQTPTCVVLFYTPQGQTEKSQPAPGTGGPTQEWDVSDGATINPNSKLNNVYAAIGSGNCQASDTSRALSPVTNNVITPPAPPNSPTPGANTTKTITATYNYDTSNNTTTPPNITQNALEYWPLTATDCKTQIPTSPARTTPQLIPQAQDTINGLAIGTTYCVRSVTLSAQKPGLPTTGWDAPSTAVPMNTQFNPPGPLTANNIKSLASPGSFGVTIPPNGNTNPLFAEVKFSISTNGPFYSVALDLIAKCTPDTSGNLNCSIPVGSASPSVPTPFSDTSFTNLQARFIQSQTLPSSDPDPFSPLAGQQQFAWTMPAVPVPPQNPPTSADFSSITDSFTFANNPANTKYVLEAGVAVAGVPDFTSPTKSTPPTIQGPVNGLGSAKVGGLQGGQSYGLEVRAISSSGLPVLDSTSTFILTGTKFHQPTSAQVNTSAAVTTDTHFHLIVTPYQNDTSIPPYVQTHFTYTDASNQVQVASSTNNTPLTADSNGKLQVDVFVPQANTKYTGLSVLVGANPSSSDPSWSTPLSIPDVAYAKPTQPNAPQLNSVTAGSIMANVNFPLANPPLTSHYRLEADIDPTYTSQFMRPSIDYVSPSNPVTVSGLVGGLTYNVRIRAKSINTSDPTYDVFSPDLTGVTTPIAAGVPTFIGYSSATIQWVVPDLSDAVKLEATASLASDISGGTIGSPQPLTAPTGGFSSPVSLTVTNLTPSNTNYTLTLLKQTTQGQQTSTWTPYTGSSTTVTLHAAPPAMPQAAITGNAANLVLAVQPIDPLNSSDSSYGIKISSDNEATWGYLSGTGGNTLSQIAVYKPLAQWTGTAAQLSPIPMGGTYHIKTVVLDNALDDLGAEIASPVRVIGSPGGLNLPTLTAPPASVPMDKYNFGVPVGGPILASFTTGINPTALPGLTTIFPVGNPSATINVKVNKYTSSIQTAELVPATPLLPATLYELVLDSGVPDFLNIGFSTQSVSIQFFTGIDPSQPARIFSPYDTAQANSLQIGQNALGNGGFGILRTSFIDPLNAPATIGLSPAAVANAENSNINLIKGPKIEALFYNSVNNLPVQGDALSAVTLTMSLAPNGAGAAALNSSNIDLTTLNIYRVVGQNLVAVPGSSNNGSGKVTAKISKSGVYFLAGILAQNLSNSYAYPVPWKPSMGVPITFTNLTADTPVKIYTIMGELVQTLTGVDSNGNILWPVTNKDGDAVASGVYIYQIKNSFSEKRGKLIIIR